MEPPSLFFCLFLLRIPWPSPVGEGVGKADGKGATTLQKIHIIYPKILLALTVFLWYTII